MINEEVNNVSATGLTAGWDEDIWFTNVVDEPENMCSNSLPKGALKFTISNELSDPVILLPSIDSGFITKSLNTVSGISWE